MAVDTYTKLLLHMNGPNAGTSFLDSSPSNKIVAANGGAQISALQSKFGASSGYLDGSGDYLSLSDSDDWAFGSGDFTIDFWINFSDASGTRMLYSQFVDANNRVEIYLASGELNVSIQSGGPLVELYPTLSPATNTWYHIALVRYGSSFTLYVNGSVLGSPATYAGSLPNLATSLYLGSRSAGLYFYGYLDEIRITKGLARWTSAFTPPDKPYGIDVMDVSDKAIVGTPFVNVQATAAQKKWNGSAYFGGNEDGMALTVGSDWDLSTKSFTVDFWVQFSDINRDHTIMSRYTDDSNYWALQHCRNTGFKFYWYTGGVGHLTTFSEGQVNCVAGTWYHMSLVRDGNTFSLYNNGVLVARSTDTGALPSLTGPVYMGTIPPDQYTKLLLHMDGDNNSTYFKDSEQTPKAVTANGDAKISTAQSKFGGASAYFDGTGDYLSALDSDDWNFGAGDFTIDLWARFDSFPTTADLVGQKEDANNFWNFQYRSALGLCFYSYVAGNPQDAYVFGASNPLTINTWHHLAIVRNGTSLKGYIDGNEFVSRTVSGSIRDCSAPLTISAPIGGSLYFPGYLDEVRVTKGLARWTSNFAPPGGPYQAPLYGYLDGLRVTKGRALWQSAFIAPDTQNNVVDSYTKLLIKPDNGFRDSSQNQRAITNTNVTMSSSQKKLGTQSMAFDGSGDYLSVPASSDWAFGTGDFTIDFWAYCKQPTSGEMNFFDTNGGSGATNGMLAHIRSSGSIYVYVEAQSPAFSAAAGMSIIGWYHIAIARSGTTMKVFVNGIQIGSDYTTSANITNSAAVWIGHTLVGDADYNGNIDEFRITKGLARWTSNFVPEYKPYPVQTFPNRVDAETKLLIHGNQNDTFTKLLLHCDTAFYDDSGTGKAITAVATISSAQWKFGGASVAFDGTTQQISVANSADFAMGSGDFTVDLWFNPSSVSSGSHILVYHPGAGTYSWILVIRNATSLLLYSSSTGTSWNIASGVTIGTVAAATWYHLAVVRQGTNIYCYLNGVITATVAVGTATLTPGTSSLVIGSSGSDQYYDGYMDEIRISKGIARWIDSFTPPTAAYANPINDSSPSNKVVSAVNNISLDTGTVNLGNASVYFDGTSDSFTVPSSDDFNFGSDDFTIDWWEYRIAGTAANSSIISRHNTSAYSPFNVGYHGTTDCEIYMTSNGSSWDIASGKSLGAFSLNTWNHFAVVRSGNTFYAFKNGVQTDTWTSSAALLASSSPLSIGTGMATGLHFKGYMDEIRLTKGLARWTNNFTPPTKQYADAKETSTKLLLHMDQVKDASNTYFLDSATGKYVFPNGGVIISSAQSKFGASSAYFDGTGDYLSTPNSTDWDVGSGDFTIDFWLYPTGSPMTREAIFSFNGDYRLGIDHNYWGATWCINVWASSNGSSWDIINADGGAGVGTIPASANTWTHFAFVRNGNVWRTYVNGVMDVNVTVAGTVIARNEAMNIGRWGGDGMGKFTGYIEEFRFTKGLARWTAAFTPPTLAYPDYM